ncbi:MAG TPA: hypothetical protein VM344_10590 [Vitreimonas sp.]|nr:hypothetical protein [Vitreimonas sp.]
MTDRHPSPMGRDDQPTDAVGVAEDRERRDDGSQLDGPVAPSVVDLEDHERFDVDDLAKPGIDDYAS